MITHSKMFVGWGNAECMLDFDGAKLKHKKIPELQSDVNYDLWPVNSCINRRQYGPVVYPQLHMQIKILDRRDTASDLTITLLSRLY